jgi:hypothetical protein
MIFKNVSSILDGEVPTDPGFVVIAPFFPGDDFSDQGPFTWDAPG